MNNECISEARLCPTAEESFDDMVPGTYVLVVDYELGPTQQDVLHFAIGTGFGIERHTLVTAAHVAQAILDNPWPVKQVVAVQAGTGLVVELTGAVIHPGYTGEPLASPDVALLKARGVIEDCLPLASEHGPADLSLGDELALAGFPGEVTELFSIVPGETVPQATALTGHVSALRSFDPSARVSPESVDVIQHEIATTPGTSGSPIVRCGEVIAVHNAGIGRWILGLDEYGNLVPDWLPEGSANFGIHVKHVHDLMSFVNVTESALPPPPPSYRGTYSCEGYDAVSGVFTHEFVLTIWDWGTVTGVSCWADLGLVLSGAINPYGRLDARNNAADFGLSRGTYTGYVNPVSGEAWGLFYMGDVPTDKWSCRLDPGALPACAVSVPGPAINGRWDLTFTHEGELYSFCLTIESERVVEVLNGCREPDILLGAKPVVIDGNDATMEFSVRFSDGSVYSLTIHAIAKNRNLYDVVIAFNYMLGTVARYSGQMERLP